jgi:hypothetical protein
MSSRKLLGSRAERARGYHNHILLRVRAQKGLWISWKRLQIYVCNKEGSGRNRIKHILRCQRGSS